jgi:hypothetical protein
MVLYNFMCQVFIEVFYDFLALKLQLSRIFKSCHEGMPSQALPIRSPCALPKVLGQGNFYLTDRHHHVAALQLSDDKAQRPQMFTALFPKGHLKLP